MPRRDGEDPALAAEARRLRDRLALVPHPEGGWYRETWRSIQTVATPWGDRPAGTSILYLLAGRQLSRPHRLRQDEVWSFHAGTGLLLHLFAPGGDYVAHRLGLAAALQVTVPVGVWMGAETDGGWALVGCACAPGFVFADLTFADPAALLAGWPTAAAASRRLLG